MLCAAIMILWLVGIPGFLIISSVTGNVNVIYCILPGAHCLLTLVSLEAIIIAQWAQ